MLDEDELEDDERVLEDERGDTKLEADELEPDEVTFLRKTTNVKEYRKKKVLITEDMLDEDELEDEGLEKDQSGELRPGLTYKKISGEYFFFLLFIITFC